MARSIDIIGWKPGLKKVAMTHLLRTHAGLSLNEAKCITDNVLEGQVISLERVDSSTVNHLARALEAIGAVVSISEGKEKME